ncbi:hypothetical protein VF709_24545, partial [Enterobacter sp. Lyrl_3]
VDGYIYKDGVNAPNRRPGVRINCGTPNKDKGNTSNSGDWVFGEDGMLTCPGAVSLGTTKKLTIDSQNTSTLGARLHLWGNVDRPTVLEFGDDTSYHFYSQRNKDGSISFVSPGQVIPGNYGNFDQRYSVKYPTQFRVGARVTYNGSDFGGKVPQGAVNINNFTNNDDRINGVQYAYLQYNLNGNWVNFA